MKRRLAACTGPALILGTVAGPVAAAGSTSACTQLQLVRLRPAAVLIQGGHNDVGRPPAELTASVHSLHPTPAGHEWIAARVAAGLPAL